MPARPVRVARSLFIVATLTLLGWAMPGAPAVAGPAVAAGPPVPASPAAPTAPGAGPAIDLATTPAERWIVQLAEPPVAAYRGGLAGLAPTALAITGARRLDPASPAVRAYRRHLAEVQRGFRASLAKLAPGSRVDQSYSLTVNGLGVKMRPEQAAAVRALPGVRAVTPDLAYQLQMFSTPEQIGAPAVWAQLGGKVGAGRGVKVGVIDSGIFVKTDAAGAYAGNPCFRDDGFVLPTGFPKGDARFTNHKVIAARTYFRPDDPPVPGDDTALPQSSGAHGTHVAGTIGCAADTPVTYQGVPIVLDGVAPGVYLMNYKVFYASATRDGFQNGNAFVIELVKAIEDAIEDGADVISNSWGASYQNTLAWPDPMVQAAELAMQSGVVAVFANGNSGANTGTVISPAIAPSVIAVGAVTKDAGVSVGDLAVTSPAPVPESLARMDVGGAAFGPPDLVAFPAPGAGPAYLVPVETVASNQADNGCPIAGGDTPRSPYPDGALAGKVALMVAGGCQASEKVYWAQLAGAAAALVQNATAETLTQMLAQGHAADVTIPSWYLRRSDGVALRELAKAEPAVAVAYAARPHLAPMPGDVMAGFSSRGPTMDKTLKPDVAAPGVAILSSGYGPPSDAPDPGYTGFGAASGTSMACPHVAGAAALLVALHPEWRPWQVKAALMATADEAVFLDTEKTRPAGLLDRGSGRIDLTKAGAPGLFLDPPGASAGELLPGATATITITAQDAGDGAGQWQVHLERLGGEADGLAVPIVPSLRSLQVPAGGGGVLSLALTVTPEARLGDYETTLRLEHTDTGRMVHLPLWLRVLPPPATDLLLLDDDRSSGNAGLANYSAAYTATLSALGLSYRYLDTHREDLPPLLDLYRYRAALLFTGDNGALDTGGAGTGLSGAERTRLQEWLDGGGRILATGQNLSAAQGSTNGLSGSRLFMGYLALTLARADVFGGPAPRPTAIGTGPFAGLELDLSPGGDGAGNQVSIEATRPITDTDTFAGTEWTLPVFAPLTGTLPLTATLPAGAALGHARAAEPALEAPVPGIRYRALALGFGLEGLNGETGASGRRQVMERALDWLLDAPGYRVEPLLTRVGAAAAFVVSGASSSGAVAIGGRWDFGDGSPVTAVPGEDLAAVHRYLRPGRFTARLEVTNALGHRYLVGAPVEVRTAAFLPLLRRDGAAP